eukprot:COSAG06_NODE_474_length_15284_cov_124.295582_7_plen_80_part_00
MVRFGPIFFLVRSGVCRVYRIIVVVGDYYKKRGGGGERERERETERFLPASSVGSCPSCDHIFVHASAAVHAFKAQASR